MTNIHLLSHRAANTLRLLKRLEQPLQSTIAAHKAGLERLARTIESISQAPADSFKESVYQALEIALDEAIGRIDKAIKQPEESIFIEWCIEDIYAAIEDYGLPYKPTREEAMDVLRTAKDNHDATIGVNWDVLRFHIEDCLEEVSEEEQS